MSAAVHPHASADHTEVSFVVRSAIKLGLLESLFVLLIGFGSKYLDGMAETAILSVLVAAGVLTVTFLPGTWTRARTIEGIAGAAGIGLAAAWVFLVVDVAVLQNIGLYTHRWRDIGGGSNWWYHPVWWMVGTYLPWFGSWMLASRAARGGGSPAGAAASAVVFTIICAVVAVLIHFPRAGWNLGTFGVAFLPGLALATLVSVLGARRK
jgi:hypothetical protein